LTTNRRPGAYTPTAVLKRDIFSEIQVGYFDDAPDVRVVRRIVTASPWWARPLAWILARREIRGLECVRGIKGVPQLVAVDAEGLYRSWCEGTPLHLARPHQTQFYRDAHQILRHMRQRGLTHNDLAKPQNWLMSPDGQPQIIDFQLASLHKRRGLLFRYFAYEDFRHLLKQRASFANDLMTPTGWRIVQHRSWPSRLWLNTGKKIYNFLTRDLFHWSDGEGTGDRIQLQGAAICTLLGKHPQVSDVAFATYSRAAKSIGLYAFVETNSLSEQEIRSLLSGQKIESIQPVRQLPRDPDGHIREDILRLIAMNELTELGSLCAREPEFNALIQEILANRRNLTDRRSYEFERDLPRENVRS